MMRDYKDKNIDTGLRYIENHVLSPLLSQIYLQTFYQFTSNFIWSCYCPAPKFYWVSTAYKLNSKLLTPADMFSLSNN